jgi:transcriptional regulator with XRE-family HTH domain
LVTEKLRALRHRAGLSKRQLAIAAGWRGASSYQRYENADLYRRPHLPVDICQRIADALTGKGTPPITRVEVMALAGSPPEDVRAQLGDAVADLATAVRLGRFQEAQGHAHVVLGRLMVLNLRGDD